MKRLRNIPTSLIVAVATFGVLLVVFLLSSQGAQRANPVRPGAPATPAVSEQEQQKRLDSLDLDFTYTDMIKAAETGRISTVELRPYEGVAQVRLKDGNSYEVGYSPTDQTLGQRLAEEGVQVSYDNETARPKRPNFFIQMLPLFIILSLLVGFMLWSRRRAAAGKGGFGSGGMSMRKEALTVERPSVSFSDVAGVDEAVEEVREIVDYMENPDKYIRMGAKVPSGIMLYGPPGTGKTLLAKALAGESGLEFFAVSGSEFVEKFVGVGASRMRELFTAARKAEGGAVIFFDEIDAIGKKRSGGETGGADERDQTLNQLLVELDGFDGRDKIIVVAATNRLDTLDPALLRPGRFSLHVQVGLPNEKGRMAILRLHARGKPFAEDVDLEEMARMTYQCSGAQLAEILNQAALLAAREGAEAIGRHHVDEGYMRVIMGPEKKGSVLAPGEREVVAYHEAGHALVAEFCETQDKPQRITIKQRGEAAGVAVYGQTDRALHNAQFIHESLMKILGGRAAEHVKFGGVTSGAGNDLQVANAMTRNAVERLGLSPRVGQLISGGGPLSEEAKKIIDQEVERILADAYRDAIGLLEEHVEHLERLAQGLLTSEDMDRLEIVAALGEGTISNRQPLLGPNSEPAMSPSPEPVPVTVELPAEPLGSEEQALSPQAAEEMGSDKAPDKTKGEKKEKGKRLPSLPRVLKPSEEEDGRWRDDSGGAVSSSERERERKHKRERPA